MTDRMHDRFRGALRGQIQKVAVAVALLFGLATAAWSASAADVDRLIRALDLEQMVDVMVLEGHDYGATLGKDMLEDGGGAAWDKIVDRIYDPDKMMDNIRPVLLGAFDDVDIAPLIGFFESGIGAQLVTREIEARHAFLQKGTEEAARQLFRDMPSDDPRMVLIIEFMEVNELLDYNVSGAMNASYMFYRGLAVGGAYDASEDEVLGEVWSQVDTTRADSYEWLGAFLLTAYAPLPDSAIEGYIGLSHSAAGRRLNAALFQAFDVMYREISYALGLAAAERLSGQDL